MALTIASNYASTLVLALLDSFSDAISEVSMFSMELVSLRVLSLR